MLRSEIIYRTSHEVQFLRGLFQRNRQAFLSAAMLIMSDQRSYAGEGMGVDVRRIKRLVSLLLKRHELELPNESNGKLKGPTIQ